MFGFFKKKVVSESEAYRIEREKEKEKQDSGEFRMTIEDVFSITGRGTVVTGKIEAGSISVGDKINLMGQMGVKTVTVAGIEMFRKITDHAKTGDHVGILLRGVERQDCMSGDTLKKI